MKHILSNLCNLAIAIILIAGSSQVMAQQATHDSVVLNGGGGGTPFIRLDNQSNPSKFIVGFTDELAFYDGDSYSFRIFEDADSNLLNLNQNGVGVGTTTPNTGFHIRLSGNAQARVEDVIAGNSVKTLINLICQTCTPGFRLNQVTPNNQVWFFRMLQSGNFSVDDPSTAVKEAEFRSGGNLVIGGVLTQSSSRTVKKNIVPVDGSDILSRLDSLSIARWTYNHDEDAVRHMGPMAEDFYDAFGLGDTPKGITSVDTSGVALAAIKELNRQLRELRDEVTRRDAELASLKEQIQHMQEQLALFIDLQSGDERALSQIDN